MDLHFQKLDVCHVDLGWLEWVKSVDPLSFTEDRSLPTFPLKALGI